MQKNSNYKIETKSQLQLAKQLAADIKKGKNVPLVHFKNLNVLFSQLDKDKTISEKEKKEILSFILENNKKRINRKKINIEKQKIKSKKGKRNWDNTFKHKYTEKQFADLKQRIANALSDVKKAEQEVNLWDAEKKQACERADRCPRKKTKYCRKLRTTCNWYKNNPQSRKARQDKLDKANSVYLKLKAQLEAWEDADAEYIADQKAQLEEERKRQDQLNKQERHEAALKADGLSLQTLKMQIAKQAEEIAKLDAEKKKLDAENEKIKTSKNFGANITQNIKENSKGYVIAIIVLIIAFLSFAYFNSKNKKNARN